MTSPTYALLQSLVGGLTIPIATHVLLLLNGNILGISGFVHRAAVQGHVQDVVSLSGLILGGVVAGLLEGKSLSTLSISLPQVFVSGFLVGLGSKVSTYYLYQVKLHLIHPVSQWLHVRVCAENQEHDCWLKDSCLINRHMICGISRLSVRYVRCSYLGL